MWLGKNLDFLVLNYYIKKRFHYKHANTLNDNGSILNNIELL